MGLEVVDRNQMRSLGLQKMTWSSFEENVDGPGEVRAVLDRQPVDEIVVESSVGCVIEQSLVLAVFAYTDANRKCREQRGSANVQQALTKQAKKTKE